MLFVVKYFKKILKIEKSNIYTCKIKICKHEQIVYYESITNFIYTYNIMQNYLNMDFWRICR